MMKELARLWNLAILMLMATHIVACQASNSEHPQASSSQASIVAAPAKAIVPSIRYVSLSRTACYGTCPVYSVTIDADGSITFQGREFVKSLGKQTKHSETAFAAVTKLVQESGFAQWKERYVNAADGCREHWTDNPSLFIVVDYGDHQKNLHYYRGCRGLEVGEQILKLAEGIDRAADVARWIGKEN